LQVIITDYVVISTKVVEQQRRRMPRAHKEGVPDGLLVGPCRSAALAALVQPKIKMVYWWLERLDTTTTTTSFIMLLLLVLLWYFYFFSSSSSFCAARSQQQQEA
jgi:hypothetical protein